MIKKLPSVSRSVPPEPMGSGLHEIASEWFMRRQDANWTTQDEAELQAWLAAEPARRTVFESLSRTWDDFADVPRPVLVSDQSSAKALAPSLPTVRSRPQSPGARCGFWSSLLGKRVFAPAALAACILLLAGGWYRWDSTPSYTLDVSTGPGETRRLELPDGSYVDLNFASNLQVRYYPRRRVVLLDQGEAFFEVAPDLANPFTVDSGASSVTVVGTRFNVRATPMQLLVKVQEGRVHVTPDRKRPEQFVELGAAQGFAVDPTGEQHQTLVVTTDSVGDWRGGRLVFRRAPMIEVARDVERYLGAPVVLEGEASLKALPVSGFVDLLAPAAFLEALPDLLPVRVTHQPDGGYTITAR